jgi:hypothetical protein
MCRGRQDREEVSVLTVPKRLIAQPALLRQLRDPWRYVHALRKQVNDAINVPAS